MCQIDIDRDAANSTMLQGVAHNLHTSVGDLRMLAEVCAGRGDSGTATLVGQMADLVSDIVHAALVLFRDACIQEIRVPDPGEVTQEVSV